MNAVAATFEPNVRPDCTDALKAALNERIMVIDGAMGTAIQRDRPDEEGYRGDRFREWPTALQGNNDLLNLTQPQIIEAIHREYLEAGADILNDAWGGVEQGPFLNAVLVADDADLDCRGWLHRGQALERAADRVREVHWGPRTLDVDVITCHDGVAEVTSDDPVLVLPHPHAHERAFVLVPWLAADPNATLTVAGTATPVAELLDRLDPAERAGVRRTDLALTH